jgi:diguanylate cyclase (GGDEF)-like protein
MRSFFLKLVVKIPEGHRAEILRDIGRENFLRSIYCSILLIILEAAIMFVNGRDFYYVHAIVLGTVAYNLLFLPFFYVSYRKGTVKRWQTNLNLFYYWGLLLIYCSLSVLPQNEIASIDTYVMAIIGMTALLYIPPYQTALLFSSVYIAFFFALPVFQSQPYVVHVLRINAFVISFFAWVLSRLVYGMKITALADKIVIEEKNEMLKELVVRDSMTSLFNHESVYKKLGEEMLRSRRIGYPLSLMMLDIDDFKCINDRYGHIAGDRVIIRLSHLLLETCRKTDIICRFGGEEYVLIMPDTNTAQALLLSERIRRAVETGAFENGVRITLSGGICEYKNESVDELIGSADSRLYAAKAAGKDRFVADS